MNSSPILIIDDDTDDREFLQEAWEQLKYNSPLLFLNSGEELLQYLKTEKEVPFLILCDVNLPYMDGFEIKRKILEDRDTNYKSIPFVFWSNTISKAQIQKAYDLGVNGFFEKGNSLNDIKGSLINIVNYWLESKTPE